MYISIVLKRKTTNVFTLLEMPTYYSMCKLNVERIQIEKGLFDEEKVKLPEPCGFVVSWQTEKTALLFKKQRQERPRMNFWECHITLWKVPNGHAHTLRELIIYCHPTVLFLLW